MRPPPPLLRALADVLDLGAEAVAAVGLLVVGAVGALPAVPVAAAVGSRRRAAGGAGGTDAVVGPGATRSGSRARSGPVALHPAS